MKPSIAWQPWPTNYGSGCIHKKKNTTLNWQQINKLNNYTRTTTERCGKPGTSVHGNLAKGRITDLSPHIAANAFVRSLPTSSRRFLGPTWLGPPNGILTGSCTYVRFTGVPSTQTARAACVMYHHNRPHLCYACDAADKVSELETSPGKFRELAKKPGKGWSKKLSSVDLQ